jgi:hypothetical protein
MVEQRDGKQQTMISTLSFTQNEGPAFWRVCWIAHPDAHFFDLGRALADLSRTHIAGFPCAKSHVPGMPVRIGPGGGGLVDTLSMVPAGRQVWQMSSWSRKCLVTCAFAAHVCLMRRRIWAMG